jgi:radical SAM superfamily enzyme YgiQ (UPF0313 family)
VLEKGYGAAGARVRRLLPPSEADEVVDDTAALARRTAEDMGTASWTWLDAADAVTRQEALTLLDLCARFEHTAANADAARFSNVYTPVGILPPDQYLSLVLQATEGCSFNTCTFCDLYHDGYRVKTAEEFRGHVERVKAYLGESLALRSRGIFLGAANALAVPMPRLVELFEVLIEEADSITRGVSAFVDAFTGSLKHVRDYERLRDMGLRRVYVGLESGHDPLLQFVRKPGSAASAVETVRSIKQAGVPVGVIVMTGLGGNRFAAGHVADTAAVLEAMALDAGDLLYFSEFVEVPHSSYPRVAAEAGVAPLPAGATAAQRPAICAAAGFGASGPRASTYDIREFVY